MGKIRYRGIRNSKTDSEPLARLTFRIDAKHLEELNDYAEKHGMSNSFLVRHLVMRFLEGNRSASSIPVIGEPK